MYNLTSTATEQDKREDQEYLIRFNYKFIPFIWIRVPKKVWSKAVDLALGGWFIDAASRPVTLKGSEV